MKPGIPSKHLVGRLSGERHCGLLLDRLAEQIERGLQLSHARQIVRSHRHQQMFHQVRRVEYHRLMARSYMFDHPPHPGRILVRPQHMLLEMLRAADKIDRIRLQGLPCARILLPG
jgi:hypothetical protein